MSVSNVDSRIDSLTYLKLLNKKSPPVSIGNVRRADPQDVPHAIRLMTSESKRLFGNIDPGEKLDKCHISICLEDSDGEVMAIMCLDDHPNIPSIPPWEWGHWLYNIYHLNVANARNSLWIHMAVWDKRYSMIFMKHLLKAIFSTSAFLEYVLIVIPPHINYFEWLQECGTRVIPTGFYKSNKIQTLYIMVRQHSVIKYKIRRAVEEDNDDLVPLIHSYSERLQEYYGKYYIAEILTSHDLSDRKLIVAEYKEQAVSLFCLNETIHVDVLNDGFELLPFNGLRKPDEQDLIDDQDTCSVYLQPEREEVGELSFVFGSQKTGKIGRGSIESLTTGEELLSTRSDESDDFSIVNVFSLHLILSTERIADDNSTIKSQDSEEYSAMILSFDDYEMHLYDGGDKSICSEEIEEHQLKHAFDQQYQSDIPVFRGEVNAFSLELTAAKPDHETEVTALLLEAAFECFPERDYCVISLPSTCRPFPLLKHFVRVPPRPASSYPHELYVLHRNAILSKMSVGSAVRLHKLEVDNLVEAMPAQDDFLIKFNCAINGDTYRAFVLLTEEQIVGVAIVKQEANYEYLRSHYDLVDWVDERYHKPDSFGVIEYVVLTPIFQRHSRFFLAEIHRLSDYSVLFYYVSPSDTNSLKRNRTIACVLGDLTPIRPRPQPQFSHLYLDECAPADVIGTVGAPFAVYCSTSRHLSLPRYEINTKLVVVGSGDTAISFLDSLICSGNSSYQVTFTNVTIVSPHVFNYLNETNLRAALFVTRSDLTHRYMHLTSLRTYVNMIHGVMTRIDRKNKQIFVNDKSYLAYDYLFLFCGQQFQKPFRSTADGNKATTAFPDNVFLVNTETDAWNALYKLQHLALEQGKNPWNVIVYGNALETYCCLAALLDYGISGKRITFVESLLASKEDPTLTNNETVFNDPEVDAAVRAAIREAGVTHYSAFSFIDWETDPETHRIVNVTFQSHHRFITIPCTGMFMYNEKTVSSRTFYAISQAGLVFDGGLVIEPDCRTNDPYIYGAGTLTKYSRRYYADHQSHKYYNPEEIGKTLGTQIRNKLVPFQSDQKEVNPIHCERGNLLVPTYNKPLRAFCQLPGSLQYLSVTRPGKQIPLEVAMAADDYGQVLVTGNCKDLHKQGFFRLHLNEFGLVETITCLAKFDIDRANLTTLWGKHEKLLNNLQARFEMLLITDLFEYFKDAWTCAIYHDRFDQLQKDCYNILTSLADVPENSLLERLTQMYKETNWNELTCEQKEEIEDRYIDSPYQQMIEKKVLDFIRDNDTFLPMYAHPTIVRLLLLGCENSPLFQPQ